MTHVKKDVYYSFMKLEICRRCVVKHIQIYSIQTYWCSSFSASPLLSANQCPPAVYGGVAAVLYKKGHTHTLELNRLRCEARQAGE